MRFYQQALELTKQLVAIPSQNGTDGEKTIAAFLADYLRSLPYFQAHPEQVWTVPLKNDALGRFNVFALIKGEKEPNGKTVILHGHIDTVDVQDFGAYAPYAFDCDGLMRKLSENKETLSEDVRADLESGDYLFGRGASDMKGGDAVHLVVAGELAERVREMRGNVLLSFNPVEETLHKGFIDALEFFIELREKEKLEYLFAVNNDFICGMYPGDETRYVYTGSCGKMLPCFYIVGKETHVGQAFEGFDAARIAAELVRKINLNSSLCDGYDGEYPAPPLVLKMKDLKPTYSVQTTFSSFVYFNYMVHSARADKVLGQFRELAGEALRDVSQEIDGRYKDYCRLVGIDYRPIVHRTQVLEYKELLKMAAEKYGGHLPAKLKSLAEKEEAAGTDKRETARLIVEKLVHIANIKIPTVVVFFATPYCPFNTLRKEIPEEKALQDELQEILDAYARESGERFKIMHFFPSLSDSSYLKLGDDEGSIKALSENFPAQEVLYPVPYDEILALNVPGINYGTFGKDAHKWTERVKKSYSFGRLPELILKTAERYLF